MDEAERKKIQQAILKTQQKIVDKIRERIVRLEDDKRMWLKILGEEILKINKNDENIESQINSKIEYHRPLVDGCQKAITELENVISEIHGMGAEVEESE